jgi:hypothetical protein
MSNKTDVNENPGQILLHFIQFEAELEKEASQNLLDIWSLLKEDLVESLQTQSSDIVLMIKDKRGRITNFSFEPCSQSKPCEDGYYCSGGHCVPVPPA